jgi:hypothetical protein
MTAHYRAAESVKEISLDRVVLYPYLQGILGEKYCSANRIIVLQDTPSEIRVAMPQRSLPCVDEIRKILPRSKSIAPCLAAAIDIEWVFMRATIFTISTTLIERPAVIPLTDRRQQDHRLPAGLRPARNLPPVMRGLLSAAASHPAPSGPRGSCRGLRTRKFRLCRKSV